MGREGGGGGGKGREDVRVGSQGERTSLLK